MSQTASDSRISPTVRRLVLLAATGRERWVTASKAAVLKSEDSNTRLPTDQSGQPCDIRCYRKALELCGGPESGLRKVAGDRSIADSDSHYLSGEKKNFSVQPLLGFSVSGQDKWPPSDSLKTKFINNGEPKNIIRESILVVILDK